MKILNTNNEELDKVNSLSAMTNLLALNTMLEAAKVGQEGKGFATVAEEIVELTDKTEQARNSNRFLRRRMTSLDPYEIDTAIHDQLHAMEDLNASMSSITQLSAEITDSSARKNLPKKEINHLYEILGRNTGKDIA